MAYLRGNSVVDGNLYVEGALLVREVRPEGAGDVVAFKKNGNARTPGRHLFSEESTSGSLVDSVIIEKKESANDKYNVDIYVDTRNDGFTASDYDSDIAEFNINYPIERVFVVDKDKTGDANVNFGQLTALKIDGTAYADYKKFPEKITSWGYV